MAAERDLWAGCFYPETCDPLAVPARCATNSVSATMTSFVVRGPDVHDCWIWTGAVSDDGYRPALNRRRWRRRARRATFALRISGRHPLPVEACNSAPADRGARNAPPEKLFRGTRRLSIESGSAHVVTGPRSAPKAAERTIRHPLKQPPCTDKRAEGAMSIAVARAVVTRYRGRSWFCCIPR